MSTPSKTSPVELIRNDLRELCAKFARGDVRKKTFERTWTDRTVDLYREVVRERLAESEEIVREHHTILAGFKWTRSVLREPEQYTTSLFATDRRLIRLRSVVLPQQAPRCDESDNTVIDQVYYKNMTGLALKTETRRSEMTAGLVIVAVGAVFYNYLQVTGPFLIGTGLLGFLHGFLLPTRWLEVQIKEQNQPDPIKIFTLRKKSAKELAGFLRGRINPA